MKIVPFERAHLQNIVLQQKQRSTETLTDKDYELLEKNGRSFTALDGDEVLACAGTILLTHGRAHVWSYVSQNIGNRLICVTRAIKRYLLVSDARRLEMDVDCDFSAAHKWAKMLGFEMESARRKSLYFDGQDCSLYARLM